MSQFRASDNHSRLGGCEPLGSSLPSQHQSVSNSNGLQGSQSLVANTTQTPTTSTIATQGPLIANRISARTTQQNFVPTTRRTLSELNSWQNGYGNGLGQQHIQPTAFGSTYYAAHPIPVHMIQFQEDYSPADAFDGSAMIPHIRSSEVLSPSGFAAFPNEQHLRPDLAPNPAKNYLFAGPTSTAGLMNLRKLPSMNAIMNSNTEKPITTFNITPRQTSNPNAFDLNQVSDPNRRSLPSMAWSADKMLPSNERKTLVQQTKSDYSLPPKPAPRQARPLGQDFQTDNYANCNPDKQYTMRKLPIVTPYGPQPIRDRNQISQHQSPAMQNTKHNLLNGYEKPVKHKNIYQDRGLVKNHVVVRNVRKREQDEDFSDVCQEKLQTHKNTYLYTDDNNLPTTSQRINLSNSRHMTENINALQRKLPIITKQGVLKLRTKGSNLNKLTHSPVNYNDQPGEKRLYNGEQVRSKSRSYLEANTLRHQDNHIAVDAKLANKSARSSSVIEPEDVQSDLDKSDLFIESSEEHFEDRPSEEMTEEAVMNSDEIECDTSLDLNDNNLGFVQNDEFPDGEIFTNRSYDDGEEDQEIEDEDQSEKYDLQEEQEAEYFSALATVPEEESKLSDKENMHELDQTDDDEDRKQFEGDHGDDYVMKSDGEKVSSTEAEAFQAHVLEYLAEKRGIKAGELFSSNEGPESFVDEVETRGSEQSLTVSQQQAPEVIPFNSVQAFDDKTASNNTPEVYGDYLSHGTSENKLPDSNADRMKAQDFVGESEFYNKTMFYNHYEVDERERVACSDEFQLTQNQEKDQSANVVQPMFNRMTDMNGYDGTEEQFVSNQARDPAPVQIFEHVQDSFPEHPDVINYQLEDEEDERMVISSLNDKTSFEQEEYDEQYRDINNLEDLEKRATNHVHAIDGHSKSMLKGMHQQRTIKRNRDRSYRMCLLNDSPEHKYTWTSL